MKYYYFDNKTWQNTENWLLFRCKCSIFGTLTWCVDDCPKEQYKKHLIPEDCTKHIKRYGIKEIYTLLQMPNGKKILIGSLISIAITIKIIININLNFWKVEDVEARENGKLAKFRVAIITQEYRWKFESSDSIETGLVMNELPNLLDNLKGFNDMIGLIGVGAASQEGNLNQEIIRADKRADNIISVLRQNELTENKELYKLNLGKYLIEELNVSINATSVQRRLIIIGIKERERTMSFEEMKKALQKALQKSSLKYTLDTKSYSNFDFKVMK